MILKLFAQRRWSKICHCYRLIGGVSFSFLVTLCTATYAEDGPSNEELTTENTGNPASEIAAPDDEKPPESLSSKEYAFQKELEKEIDSFDSIWVTVNYPSLSETVEVLGLEQASRLPNAQGAVLLLHDKFHHANWPGALRVLRETLPDSGWHTLSISLPSEATQKLPDRELPAKTVDRINITPELEIALNSREASGSNIDPTPKENEGDNANNELEQQNDLPETDGIENAEGGQEDPNTEVDINLSVQDEDKLKELPYSERVQYHIEAGMKHLADRGYLNNILVAFGQSAQAALEYIEPKASSIEAQGFALILVNAKLGPTFSADIGKAIGKQFQAPILDIVDGSQPENLKYSKRRLTMAKVAKAATYKQVILPTIDYGREQKTLLKRIDAWLKVYAPGMSARSIKNF